MEVINKSNKNHSKDQQMKLFLNIYIFIISLLLVACFNQTSTPQNGIVLGVTRTLFNLPDTYVVSTNNDGNIKIKLPANLGSTPEWTSDGKWIISSTKNQVGRPEDSAIYLMRSDGSDRRLVIHNSGGSFDPSWSPDDTQIVYFAEGYPPGIYTLDIKCFQQQEQNCNTAPFFLTKSDGSPNWSPDGKKIAYQNEDGIFIIQSNGVQPPMNLTPNMKYCHDPKWSPDGIKILFSCYLPDHFDIFTVNSNGSDLKNLTQGSGINIRPKWSPDGGKIFFISDRGGLGKIIGMDDTIRSNALFVMNNDGSNVVRLSLRDDEDILWFSLLPLNYFGGNP